MTRVFYNPATQQEVRMFFAYRAYCWRYNPSQGVPVKVPYWNTDEDDLLFNTKEDCTNYWLN